MRDDRPLLLVSPLDETKPRGGRDMVSVMNLAVLADIYGDRLLRFRLKPVRAEPRTALLRGYVDGVDEVSIAAIRRSIDEQDIGQIFLDGSNLGGVARAIRQTHPQVRIITFCHNIETRFFLSGLRHHPTPKAAGVFLANAMAERFAVRFSHTLFCLSNRDGRAMRHIFGRAPDAVLPLAIADNYRPSRPGPEVSTRRYALFVGGGFYANVAGIRWYLRKVAPNVGLATVIVGRGLDALDNLCRDKPDVLLAGEVGDLAPWYRGAHLVIAPILSGSGMKTKIAEALMHGKHVIGSPEAFSGYDEAIRSATATHRTAASFGQAVRDAATQDLPPFDPAMRALYERFHSFAAARERMAAALANSR